MKSPHTRRWPSKQPSTHTFTHTRRGLFRFWINILSASRVDARVALLRHENLIYCSSRSRSSGCEPPVYIFPYLARRSGYNVSMSCFPFDLINFGTAEPVPESIGGLGKEKKWSPLNRSGCKMRLSGSGTRCATSHTWEFFIALHIWRESELLEMKYLCDWRDRPLYYLKPFLSYI
jgi:hypothetical protein